MADDVPEIPEFDDDPSGFQQPAWWLKNLSRALHDRRNGRDGTRRWSRMTSKPTRIPPGLTLLNDYLRGDPPLSGYAESWGDEFRFITRLARLNVCENIISAKSGRMRLRGFRTAADRDELGDERARDIMRANKFKIVAREVHRYQLWARVGYAMVTPNDGDIPPITAEDPRETITAHDAATGQTLAALKLFRSEWDSEDLAHLYIRRGDGKFDHYPLMKAGRTSIQEGPARFLRGWELTDQVGTLDRSPIIRFRNRGDRGEFEWHLDTIDRINDEIMDKLVIAKVQAFRQMAVRGLPDKVDKVNPSTGEVEEIDIDYSDAFHATPGSLWRLPAGAEMWESQPTDLGPLRLAIKDDLQDLAAATQTSLPSMTPDAASGSAEGASLMREAEVSAAEECIDYADGAWAEVMSTAFAFMGDEKRADIAQIEPMWAPVERYSLQEKADADSKAGGLPIEVRWTDIWQYDPADVPRLRQLRGADLLTNPVTPPSSSPGGTGVPPVTFQQPGEAAPANQGGQGDTGTAG